ncbi:MAG TPA: Ig-like domain-containing protein [Opitutaceae bacterium]|nr:Ig-like domain-containing protein [Opitutaceae bacterium]
MQPCHRRFVHAEKLFSSAFALLLLFVALSAHTLNAAEFYVAPTGSDSNAGTIDAPFATLMQAQAAASAGDTVWVRGGTYKNFAIAATDANYNYVHVLNKSGVTYSAYASEKPVFDFTGTPTNLRVCGFRVTGSALTIIGFEVTGVPVGNQKQSECWRIDGSAAQVDFYDCVAHDNAANGFYFTNRSRGSCTRCDSYNNIGTNSEAIGNTDGFGAHGNGVAFRYCRAWNNSDDGFDCISSIGANVFDHCWSFNHHGPGDSNGFKIGGFGADPSTIPPNPVPVHTVSYCLSVNNNAHGFYANHQPGQAAVWTHNSAYNNSAGNFDMLERTSDMSADIPGFREVLHDNIAYVGTAIKDDNNPPENTTNNSWNIPGVTVDATDFVSVDATQLTQPRGPGGAMPFITFMHLTPSSDLAGLGCFAPPPAAPTDLIAAWANSTRINLSWTASADATMYTIKRATTAGGPYTAVAARVTATSFSDNTITAGNTYYYTVTAMNDIAYDESAPATEATAVQPSIAVTAIDTDTGRSTSDGVTHDNALVLHGVGIAGNQVTVSRADLAAPLGSANVDTNGQWSFDYTGSILADGSYAFRASGTVNGTEFTSDPFNVTIDTATPAAPAISRVNADPQSIEGTAEPLSEIHVSIDGTLVATTAITQENGSWILPLSTALSSGEHMLFATATDIAGNASAPSASFTFDSSLAIPVIQAAITNAGNISDQATTNDATLSLTGTADANITVNITREGSGIVGTAVANGSGVWIFNYTATTLPEGVNRFTATASNGTGTSQASAPFTLTVDTVPPAVTSIVRQEPADATITSAITSVVFRVSFAEDVQGVTPASFAVTATDSAAAEVTGVSASSGTSFDVTVGSITGLGTLRLDVKSSGSGITDTAGNAASGFTTGEVYTRIAFLPGNGTWNRPTSGGAWSEAANWLGAVIPDASTHSANFSALDITANNTVVLDSPRTLNSIAFGDTATSSAASWVLDNNGAAANTLTLAGAGPIVTVNPLGSGATTTFRAALAGSNGFSKLGTGTLVLSTANPITGPLSVGAGILRLDTTGTLANTTLALGSGGQLEIDGGTYTASGLASFGAPNTVFAVKNGTAALNGGVRITSDGPVLRVSGGTFSTTDINVQRSSANPISFTTGIILTGGTSTANTVSLGTSNSNGAMSIEGGALTVTGPIIVGNQVTAGRGGGMRILSGSLTSTDTALGLVLARNSGANTNNVATATFSGGVATLEKITLGYDSAVVAGSGTVTVNGGTLYLGSGGIVKNGASGMTTTVSLSAGTLGAKANWSTSQTITLPTNGNITIKTANVADEPFDITLDGPLAGSGGFTKTGGGTLTLNGASTYTGPTTVSAGTLRVNASLTAGSPITLSGTASLTGSGPINRSVVLGDGAALTPGGAGTIGSFRSSEFTWSAGARVDLDIGANGASDQLVLTGALHKGAAAAGGFTFALHPVTGYAVGNHYTLATFASTDFTAADLQATGLPAEQDVNFTVTATTIEATIIDKPVAVIALGGLRQAYDGTAKTVSVGTAPAGLTVHVTYNGASTAPHLPGTYDVVATVDDPHYLGSTNAQLEITITALTRHAPVLNGDIDGSAQVLLPENVTFNSGSMISGDLLLPGTPSLRRNGSATTLGGIKDETGNAAPTTQLVTMNGNALLRYLVRRVDAISLPVVTAPHAPTGTRNVSLNNANQSPGDFATLRNLTLNSNAGVRAIPAGVYGEFTANGSSAFVFGVEGATEPAVYELQRLTLNSSGTPLRIVGPVILKLAQSLSINGGTVGASAHPEWLQIEVSAGGLTLNQGSTLHGTVAAPAGTVTLNSATLNGQVSTDRLTLNGTGLLKDPATANSSSQ